MLIYLSVLETDREKHEFMALYSEYHAVMLRVAKKYFPVDQMAREDAVQNAWMKIVKNFQKISAIECKKRGAYCVIIVKNECISILRKNKAEIRFDRIMQILIQHYIMYFNTITTPMSQRDSINPTEIKQQFSFTDMKDLYLQSLFLRNKGYEPAITAFYEAELELRKYCTEFASQVDFKYNQDILNDLTQFVEVSLSYDVRNAVLGNMTMRLGKKTYIEVIQDYIADSEHDWVSEIHNKNNSNMMAPYVCLFEMLNLQKTLIVQYISHIQALKAE